MTDDEEVLAAAVLHDTVEDTGATLEQLAEQFGKRVAALVASETEDKRPQLSPGESWRTRKEESLAYLKNAADPGVKLIWLGDKLSNMRSFHREWKRSGNAMWESFNQKDPAQQAWYYRSGAALLAELKDYEAWQEYSAHVDAVFAELP